MPSMRAACHSSPLAFMLPDGGLVMVLIVLISEQTAVLALSLQPDPSA